MVTVTYYFNDYDGSEYWSTSPGNMTDGNDATYASTASDSDIQLCTSNTCAGIDLGGITKVEIRIKGGYAGIPTNDILLRPVFSGGDGSDNSSGLTIGVIEYCDWIDITTDTNSPSSWTWDSVVSLDIDVETEMTTGSTFRCYIVEVRITYNPKAKDLQIYYDSLTGSDFINCWCSRWDVQNYNVIAETWMKKADLQTLRANITPQAVGELYTILGRPRYYDSTWRGENTLMFSPNSNFQLANMRNDVLVYVKNITDTPVAGPSGWLNVKIEGMISGTGAL